MANKRTRKKMDKKQMDPLSDGGPGVTILEVEGHDPIRVVDRRITTLETEKGIEPLIPPSLKPIYVQELERRVVELESQRQDAVAEIQAEAARIRDRLSRDLERRLEEQTNRILTDFLEVLDNLERALDAAKGTGPEDALFKGISMIYGSFNKKMENLGLIAFGAPGDAFDPRLHEALQIQPVSDPAQDGVVTAVWQRGYRVGETVLRPVRVCVGCHSPLE